MKTDKLIYLLCRLLPESFFALIGRKPEDAAKFRFESPEVKELSFRLDGVFIPLVPDEPYYFMEAQFQVDDDLYTRIVAEVYAYMKQNGTREWRAVAIYPSQSAEQKSLVGNQGLLDIGLIQRIYLDVLPNNPALHKGVGLFKLVAEPEKTAPTLAKELITNATLAQIDFIEQIVAAKFSKLSREEIKVMLGIQEEILKDTQFYRDILKEGIEKGIEQGIEKGIEQGIEKGIEQGELKAKLETVPLLRELGLTDKIISQRLGIPLDVLKKTK
jgi:predicted transposase/invertase (TIGR01784 family)